MKLKIKFISAAFALTLSTMGGTAEAAFLSSTAWLDMASLTWETVSGDARFNWGSEIHNAESAIGDISGTLLSQNQSGSFPVSTNLMFNGLGIAFADAYSNETLAQTSVIDAGNAMAAAVLERYYSISGSGNILLKVNYFLNQEVSDLTEDLSFSNANVQLLDTLGGDQTTAFNQILGFDVISAPNNGNYSFTDAGTLELSLKNLNEGNQGSLVFLAYGNVDTNLKAVPEPSIAWLLGSGLIALISRRRKV